MLNDTILLPSEPSNIVSEGQSGGINNALSTLKDRPFASNNDKESKNVVRSHLNVPAESFKSISSSASSGKINWVSVKYCEITSFHIFALNRQGASQRHTCIPFDA